MDFYNRCYGCMEEITKDGQCPHCGWVEGSAPESALHLPPGMILQEKFLIGKVLGQGGFGITYLAWDFNLNLKLAIKEYLPQELAYRTGGQSDVSIYKQSLAANFNYGLEKFLEEARTLARFNEHPNIVSVRDFFKANGTGYLVMNYMEGVTLKQYMESRKEPLSFEKALNIFIPVLDALREVHAAGILHRDISPDNLLLDAQGRVVLIDFGAARQAMGEKSRSLSVIMKPGYSPLEQYQSKGKQGPWTDIYAVAATIYHAVTGVMPPESLDRIKEDPLAPPSTIGVKIESPQEDALLKALAVQAEDRLQTVEEFQAKLLEGKPDGIKKSLEADQPVKPQDEHEVTKKCPFCSEKIKATAIVCRYCKMDLQKGQQQAKEKLERPLPEDVEKGARFKEKAGSVKSEVKYSEDADGQKAKAGGSASKTADRMPGILKAAVIVLVCGLFIFGAISLFAGGDDVADPDVTEAVEEGPGAVDENGKSDGIDETEPGDAAEEPPQTFYYIDYENGTISLGDLPIGTRVIDPSWEWEFRTGIDYTFEAGDETKPVTWLVVAKDHYDGLEPHVTLLAEELIGQYAFDNSSHLQRRGYNHWGESGTHSSAYRGLRPWLNSSGIHSGDGFYRAFSVSFKNAVLTTTLPNREWRKGTSYNTNDNVFIPSTTELGDSDHDRTFRIGSVYAYFSGVSKAKRVARLGGEAWWYWTRSPDSDFSHSVRGVISSGGLSSSGGARFNIKYRGVRPALNLKSETLVSEIKY